MSIDSPSVFLSHILHVMGHSFCAVDPSWVHSLLRYLFKHSSSDCVLKQRPGWRIDVNDQYMSQRVKLFHIWNSTKRNELSYDEIFQSHRKYSWLWKYPKWFLTEFPNDLTFKILFLFRIFLINFKNLIWHSIELRAKVRIELTFLEATLVASFGAFLKHDHWIRFAFVCMVSSSTFIVWFHIVTLSCKWYIQFVELPLTL